MVDVRLIMMGFGCVHCKEGHFYLKKKKKHKIAPKCNIHTKKQVATKSPPNLNHLEGHSKKNQFDQMVDTKYICLECDFEKK